MAEADALVIIKSACLRTHNLSSWEQKNTHKFSILELEKTRLELEQLKLDSEVAHLATAPENCGDAADIGIKTSRMITLGGSMYF